MNESTFVESLQETEAWPVCPQCGSKEMLAGGPFIGCLNCMFTGSIRTFVKQGCTSLAHARIKTISGPNGIYSSLFFSPANMKVEQQIVRENRRIRVLQINALGYSMPVLAEAVIAAAAGNLELPHLVTFPEIGAIARKDVMVVSDDLQVKSGRIRAANVDMACHLLRVGSRVQMTVNLIGIPTFVISAPVTSELTADFMPEVRYHDIDPGHVFGIQPVAWEIMPFLDGTIYPRYLASLTVENQLTVTLAVSENMEGLPYVSSCRRDPANPTDFEVKHYAHTDSDEAIAELRQKFMFLKDTLGDQVVYSMERQWDLSADIIEILGDVAMREESMWKAVTTARGGTTFR